MSELHEQIERYLTGKMPESEHSAFKERLKQEADLAKEVEIYQGIDGALSNKNLRDFSVMLEEVKKEHQRTNISVPAEAAVDHQKNGTFNLKTWYAIAAVISLMVIASITLWPTEQENPAQWYQENFSPYPAQALRNLDDRYPDGLADALTAYRQKEYTQAAEILLTWQNDSIQGPLAIFYRANALMASGDVEAAVSLWENQLTSEETVFTQSVQWYAALAYLSRNNLIEARKLALQIVSTPQHAYKTEAEKLLNDLFD